MSQFPTYSNFLTVPTPQEWLHLANKQLPLLLIDHAHCERKAAASAIHFISKYPEKKELVTVMSPLAREEMLHFEKVIELAKTRGVSFGPLQPSNYAQALHKNVTVRCGHERLRDQLIIGAIIEARSCERFASLVNILEDKELASFYTHLAKAEARHFHDYLNLAYLYGENVDKRVKEFLEIEAAVITGKDTLFRFHSGIM
ncbi:tRNA-(ms(2)io(6)a)-hydrolase(tRNA hydroxylase) (plasmid) [Legionella adelaidensis]|uniref:Hydroxylase for synthesis of 2-methylthio-cis-ribozeatin in tRNA n=1 Tax=Legionella adelaidensis TaxID=45056 RepID=A0A0W0R1F6_9GAMM|nr:tRNA-(ms[2]io[6]A)-hydroxylase [Legionella adelaidensis]KTC64903.1 hydroxylase for synthesis of 2-methylthio-cis-ribozeatin in tRNA [Legionella adelaidensis]VEH85586.1 tRNA-(ms(2)io(6)a)-hydrolase(tRNA hydroxylase) [Legionella adelaidensis]